MPTGKDKDFGTIATGHPEKADVRPDSKTSIDVLGYEATQGVVDQTFYFDVPHRGPIDYAMENMIPQDDKGGKGQKQWEEKMKKKQKESNQ